MLLSANSQTRDSAGYNTNAPFSDAGDAMINGIRIPPGHVLSIRLTCTEGNAPPFRLSSIARVPDRDSSVAVKFSDSAGTLIGECELALDSEPIADESADYLLAFIVSGTGVLRGHIAFRRELPGLLLGALESAGSDEFRVPSGSLNLLPQSLVGWLNGRSKGVVVNGERLYGNVRLLPGKYIRSQPAGGSVRLGVIGQYDEANYDNRLCRLVLHDENGDTQEAGVAGRHLIIRSTVTSNIRVADGTNIGAVRND